MKRAFSRWLLGIAIIQLLGAAPSSAGNPEVGPLLARIKAVGREGTGNDAAATAWRELVRCGPESLPAILAGFDQADNTAANWLRTAVDTIAERALKQKSTLPAAELEAFVLQAQHKAAARRLAYEWLVRVDPKAPGRLLPGMLHDPSVELRRDAVALVIQDGKQHQGRAENGAAVASYQKALAGARDRDQVDLLAKQLKTLGVEVDLPAHFGFIQKWRLAGPFDSTGGVGFQRVYPPEQSVERQATYAGKQGAKVAWRIHSTSDPYGLVDLNKALGKHMGAVAYAFALVESPAAQCVELRAGSNNAVKIYLNRKQIFFREEYHHGMAMDQHVATGVLQAGRNEILVKVCQNEQTEDWAQSWSFQLRVCDAVGGAVPLTVVVEQPATPTNVKRRAR